MFCQKCGSENPDGSVFCNSCGSRIVESVSDMHYGSVAADDKYYYEDHFFGMTRRFNRDGFMIRLVPVSILGIAMGSLLMIAGYAASSEYAMLVGLSILALVTLVLLFNMALVRHYRKTGKPVNWGGAGMGSPSAEDVMAIEDDSLDARADPYQPRQDARPGTRRRL